MNNIQMTKYFETIVCTNKNIYWKTITPQIKFFLRKSKLRGKTDRRNWPEKQTRVSQYQEINRTQLNWIQTTSAN